MPLLPVTSPFITKITSPQFANLVAWWAPCWTTLVDGAPLPDMLCSNTAINTSGTVSYASDATYGNVPVFSNVILQTTPSTALGIAQGSFFAAVRPASYPSVAAALISNRGSGNRYQLYMSDGAGNFGFIPFGSAGLFTSSSPLALNEWTRIGCVYGNNGDANVFKLFCNGDVVATGTYGSPMSTGSSYIRLGEDFFGNCFDGQMTDIRIYNAALSDDLCAQITSGSTDLYSFSNSSLSPMIGSPFIRGI